MRLFEIQKATQCLNETPSFTELTGRDGLAYQVWKNPTKQEFRNAIKHGSSTDGLRGLLTGTDLYIWQSINLLHADFERDTTILGVRIALRSDEVRVNDETIDQPEHFPWIFTKDVFDMDIEARRTIVAAWLLSNDRLNRLYANGFKVTWYS